MKECARFGFLDTSVITYRLYGSNPRGKEAIEALTARVHIGFLTSSFLLKKEKRKRENARSDRRRRR